MVDMSATPSDTSPSDTSPSNTSPSNTSMSIQSILSIIVITRGEETIEILHGLDRAEAIRDAQIVADYAHYPQLNAPAFAALDFSSRNAGLGGSLAALAQFERVEPRDIIQIDVLAQDYSGDGAVVPTWTWVRPADQD
jgi:hypothetical protein